MNVVYAKTLLYAYTYLDDMVKRIDELVVKKAFLSGQNYVAAKFQYEEIINLTYEKDIIHVVKIACDKALGKFSDEEMKYFRYKYFKNMDKKERATFDFTSRTYFRRQNKLTGEFSERLERFGLDDKFFMEECLSVDFFKHTYSLAKEQERKSVKRKTPSCPFDY